MVLSTNSSIAIVINNVLSVIYLDEKVVWAYDVTAVTLIIVGSLVIVFLSDYSETTYTPEDIRALLFSTQTLVFTVTLIIFAILTVI